MLINTRIYGNLSLFLHLENIPMGANIINLPLFRCLYGQFGGPLGFMSSKCRQKNIIRISRPQKHNYRNIVIILQYLQQKSMIKPRF